VVGSCVIDDDDGGDGDDDDCDTAVDSIIGNLFTS
jgi:hypothetical protein